MSKNLSLEELAKQWTKWDKNPETRAEVQTLLDSHNTEELEKIMTPRIAFGTAGLRGTMRAGFHSMNDLVIQQTSQGLAEAVKKYVKDALSRPVVIGYDGRHHSKNFAKIASQCLVKAGFKVLLFRDVVPTPFVPFCCGLKKCACGIMVTASHNPKADNGYKVYWENACQITEPYDKYIAATIEDYLEPWDLPDVESEEYKSHVEDPYDEVFTEYVEAAKRTVSFTPEENVKVSSSPDAPKIVYSAMHGVGTEFVKRAIKSFGLQDLILVERQCYPDPEFSTVAFPNPEEGKGSLELSIKTANEHGADLILANDPDADRLAVAERMENGEWKIFSGNELGAIIGAWYWRQWHKKHPDVAPKDCCCVSTAVSSCMLGTICEKEGIDYEETLTGFKWIGNVAKRHMNAGQHFIFGFEEAIGFLPGEMSLDKDGVRTACLFCELYNYLRSNNTTVVKYLDSLYKEYGYHLCKSKYFFCYDPALLRAIFARIREGGYPKKIGRWNVVNVRDVTLGTDTRTEDGKSRLPVTPSTEMITFYFENGCVATLRGSGTEPKLKYYVELRGKLENKEQVEAEHTEMVQAIVDQCLEPERNGLVPPKA